MSCEVLAQSFQVFEVNLAAATVEGQLGFRMEHVLVHDGSVEGEERTVTERAGEGGESLMNLNQVFLARFWGRKAFLTNPTKATRCFLPTVRIIAGY